MSHDEQFARRLRGAADGAPAIPVDAQRVLSAGRLSRRRRSTIGAAAGVVGIAVAVAAFSALQPAPAAVVPAGPTTSPTWMSSAAATADDEARAARTRDSLLRAEAERQDMLTQLTMEAAIPNPQLKVPVVRYITPTEYDAVYAQCLREAGFDTRQTASGVFEPASDVSNHAAFVVAYYTCAAEYPVASGEASVSAP